MVLGHDLLEKMKLGHLVVENGLACLNCNKSTGQKLSLKYALGATMASSISCVHFDCYRAPMKSSIYFVDWITLYKYVFNNNNNNNLT